LSPGAIGQLHGGEAGDFPGQLRIEIAAGVVRHARQVDDGVDAGEIIGVGIADIAAHHRHIRMRLEEIAEPHDVEGHDLVSGFQQLWNENASLIAAGTSEKNLHEGSSDNAGAIGAAG
jgi:hypothetical protein